MIRITMTALALAFAVPAMAETTWTGTGPRGGTIAGSGQCGASEGAITCSKTGQYTNPVGQVWTNESTRVRTRNGITVNGSVTGPGGRVTEFNRNRSN
jgi:hypothetical protein